MMLAVSLIFFGAKAGSEDGQNIDVPNIDEIMSLKLADIDRVFSDFDRTKALNKLAEIEKLNEEAGNALVDWWHSATALCCRLGKVEDRKAYRENETKLNKHLKSLCNNSVKVADRYADMKHKKKARTIYKYVTSSFEPSTFADCIRQAERRLGNLK